jgi:hypothetical protein
LHGYERVAWLIEMLQRVAGSDYMAPSGHKNLNRYLQLAVGVASASFGLISDAQEAPNSRHEEIHINYATRILPQRLLCQIVGQGHRPSHQPFILHLDRGPLPVDAVSNGRRTLPQR